MSEVFELMMDIIAVNEVGNCDKLIAEMEKALGRKLTDEEKDRAERKFAQKQGSKNKSGPSEADDKDKKDDDNDDRMKALKKPKNDDEDEDDDEEDDDEDDDD